MKKYFVYGTLGVAAVAVVLLLGRFLSYSKKVNFIQNLFKELSDEITVFKQYPEEFSPGDISRYTQEALAFIHTVADYWDIEIVNLSGRDDG